MKQGHFKTYYRKLKHQKDNEAIRSTYLFALKSFRFGQPIHISVLIHFIIKNNF